jgi:hypothetical protein
MHDEGELLGFKRVESGSVSVLAAVVEFYEATVAHATVAKYNNQVIDVGDAGDPAAWSRLPLRVSFQLTGHYHRVYILAYR